MKIDDVRTCPSKPGRIKKIDCLSTRDSLFDILDAHEHAERGVIEMHEKAGRILSGTVKLQQCSMISDKFHVMKYVYDAVGEVRKRIVRELQSSLSKRQMPQCEEGRKLLAQTTD